MGRQTATTRQQGTTHKKTSMFKTGRGEMAVSKGDAAGVSRCVCQNHIQYRTALSNGRKSSVTSIVEYKYIIVVVLKSQLFKQDIVPDQNGRCHHSLFPPRSLPPGQVMCRAGMNSRMMVRIRHAAYRAKARQRCVRQSRMEITDREKLAHLYR